ncbi:antitoxin [Enterococcus mundtii]|uniref:antitoxin n=1 Tax=Enterococcus mundtii TaxID=53346 RepID=UPI00397101E1
MKPYDYNQTLKIEHLNELSKGTTARLIGYLTNENIEIDNRNNFFALLYQQFKEMLNLNLFSLSDTDLKRVEQYWQKMNDLVSTLSK